MTKIIWGINIPYAGTRYIGWDKENNKSIREPCIYTHEQMFFELCDVCGNQIIKGRFTRGLTTCSPKCHALKKDGWLFQTEQQERELVGERMTYFWWKVRSECFERDNNTCQICRIGPEKKMVKKARYDGKNFIEYEEEGIVFPDLHAHHIKPIKDGGNNKLENLITLCGKCHKNEHSHTRNVARKHRPLVIE